MKWILILIMLLRCALPAPSFHCSGTFDQRNNRSSVAWFWNRLSQGCGGDSRISIVRKTHSVITAPGALFSVHPFILNIKTTDGSQFYPAAAEIYPESERR